jgi:secreted PhoX family phosphatase
MNAKMSRRKFLAAASAGGAAAAVVAVTGQDEKAKPDGTQAAAQGKGYQVTAHVRRYYETTKV